MAMETNSADEDTTSMKELPSTKNMSAPTPQQPKQSTMGPPGTVAIPSAKPPRNPSTPREDKPEGGAEDKEVLVPPPPPQVSSSQRSNPAAGGSYKPPSWGVVKAPEASGLSLTVLKSGVEVNSISLDNRTHVLLGEPRWLKPTKQVFGVVVVVLCSRKGETHLVVSIRTRSHEQYCNALNWHS